MTRRPTEREIRIALGVSGPMDHLGRIAFIAAVAVLMIGAVVALVAPVGKATSADGVVVALTYVPTEVPSGRSATVRLGESRYRVRIAEAADCRVGDHIRLLSRRTLTGGRHLIAYWPRTCERGPRGG